MTIAERARVLHGKAVTGLSLEDIEAELLAACEAVRGACLEQAHNLSRIAEHADRMSEFERGSYSASKTIARRIAEMKL